MAGRWVTAYGNNVANFLSQQCRYYYIFTGFGCPLACMALLHNVCRHDDGE